MKMFLVLSLSDDIFIMLINVKTPTIVGVLTFMSRINLCSAEFIMEKVLLPRGQVISGRVAFFWWRNKDIYLSFLMALI